MKEKKIITNRRTLHKKIVRIKKKGKYHVMDF